MKQIKVEKLNAEGFRLFGSYLALDEVFTSEEYSSDWTFELYRGDNLTMSLGKTNTVAGFSFGLLKKRPLVVKELQSHCHTEKTILLEKDSILVVAPVVVGNKIGESRARAFLVPSGTLVKLNFSTWYSVPFLVEEEACLYAQCEALRTYSADTDYYTLEEEINLVL